MWNENNYAYKKYHSTINALMDLVEIWAGNIDSNLQNMNMFLDLSCAFNCVQHSTLLQKLQIYKFGPKSLELIESYLKYRTQFVSDSGRESNYLWNQHGVPQGLILGPFFFNLYVQELSEVVSK